VLIHPILERLANDSEDDVSQILSVELLDLCFDGQRLHSRRVVPCKLYHLLDLQASVVWNRDELYSG
jgi:hypothetical protein